ncbi:MAG TPA: cbb3-type cytochrome c oxidase subunit I [Gammaproteobacteria bacterium]|nr:cbb3-type cytochrome c oxidase subunit I [Gammaproteobacteria bacterium]
MTQDENAVIEVPAAAKRSVVAYLAVAATVVLLMMLFGLWMRLAQGELATLAPDRFYQILTIHGAGMVGAIALASVAVQWFFLNKYLDLSARVFVANLGLFLIGVVAILASVFLGGFAGGWTFLYPLPAHSMGIWGRGAAALFMGGLLVIGTGFLLLYLDIGRALLARYGSLWRSLGVPQLLGSTQSAPPAAVIAGTMVLIVNTLGIVAGAAILVMSLVNLYDPAFRIDPLLAKNMIYFFGHVFINATIYMAITAVYEILPVYTGRPWKSSRVFIAGWVASTVMVIIVYPHHLLMDFAMPEWAEVVGQVISYTSGLPVLVVTSYGALTIVHRSGIRWDLASGLLFLSAFGWAAGVIPAIIDATIVVNQQMHNTLWVPGHFHFYLLIGVVSMVFGFMSYLARGGRAPSPTRGGMLDGVAFWGFVLGSLGFVAMFLYSGSHSVPRRYAVHLAQWEPYDRIASLFAAVVVLAVAVFLLRFFRNLRNAVRAEA